MAVDYGALIQAMMASPEVQELMKRTARKSAEAEAGAKGEAQRRGFVSPTGTSDIEFAMRSAALRPIEEAGQNAYALPRAHDTLPVCIAISSPRSGLAQRGRCPPCSDDSRRPRSPVAP